jgi:hypothetical protein
MLAISIINQIQAISILIIIWSIEILMEVLEIAKYLMIKVFNNKIVKEMIV